MDLTRSNHAGVSVNYLLFDRMINDCRFPVDGWIGIEKVSRYAPFPPEPKLAGAPNLDATGTP